MRWNIFSINSKMLSFKLYPSDQILNNGYRHIIRSLCSINPNPLGFSIKSIFEFTCSYDMQPARRTSVPHPPHQLFNSIIIPWISQLIYICFMGILQCIDSHCQNIKISMNSYYLHLHHLIWSATSHTMKIGHLKVIYFIVHSGADPLTLPE